MEVKLQSGDTITIPEGCKAIVKDGSVVFEKEQKFKDGDILALADYINYSCPFIYKGTGIKGFHQFYVGVNCVGRIVISDGGKRWGAGTLRHATEEEKHLLFDKMKEQGLRWNAEKKRVETIRWRAKEGEDYYCITERGHVVGDEEGGLPEDIERYEFGNYFRTREQAEETAKRVKETLCKYHEETGE